MTFINNFKGFVFFWKGLQAANREMWVSVQVLLVLTLVLSVPLYLFEHAAQPGVYKSLWDSIVWSFMGYLGNPGKFACGDPITIPGRFLWIIISIIKLALFAIPAGLVANGFRAAMAKDKREEDLKNYRERLTKAFQTKQCRYTKYQVVPRFRSVVDVQAVQQLDTKDIIDAVNSGANFRLCNLAATQNVSDYPVDKLVIEHFPVTEGVPYGCKINRGSNVTIVSTSSVNEAGIGNFAYYIAKFGNFNYISKEKEVNLEEPTSFYVINDPEDEKSNAAQFIRDIKDLSKGKASWTIFMISASGAEEPEYPTHFHFIYGAKIGDEGYDDPNLTIIDKASFDSFYQNLSQKLESDFGYLSDRHRYHSGAGKKNIARRIDGGIDTNAFTLRTAFKVSIWDDRNIIIAKNIAVSIKEYLAHEEFVESESWKQKTYGYN